MVDDTPGLETPDDSELAGPVHGHVDGVVLLDPGDGVGQVFGEGDHAAQVSFVEVFDRGLVLRVVVGPVVLVSLQRVVNVPWQLAAPLVAALDPQGHAGRRVGDDETTQARVAANREHGAQHAAPRLAQEVEIRGHAEVRHEVVEFGEEQVRRPEGRVEPFFADVRRPAGADLVVEDDGDLVLCAQARQVEQVVVRHARSAMHRHQRTSTGG